MFRLWSGKNFDNMTLILNPFQYYLFILQIRNSRRETILIVISNDPVRYASRGHRKKPISNFWFDFSSIKIPIF